MKTIKRMSKNANEVISLRMCVKDLDLASAVEGRPIPYYPGVLKYFAEKGLKIR
jgi:TRAP-type uncharacterized transport system substrate-binding protein